jgi:TolA-binding protein
VVEGGRIDPSGVLRASSAAGPTVRFSDGTRVAFLPGAKGRLSSVDEHGARLELSGKIDVAVVPGSESRWFFEAGPFVIQVTGTTFDAEWREAEQRLEVALRTGAVQVIAPLLDGPLSLRAGQHLVISGREREVSIRELGSTRAVPQAVQASQETRPAASSAPSNEPAPKNAPSASLTNWTSELAAGHFTTILDEAEQRGIEEVLATASGDDLAALADAARYTRRDDLARRALGAQRRRFPQSKRATDAAFLLGRLEEAGQRPELALGWYDQCLREAPRGPYAAEALGRKMTVVQRLQGAAAARPIAEEYLRRFERGTYAAAARALIQRH